MFQIALILIVLILINILLTLFKKPKFGLDTHLGTIPDSILKFSTTLERIEKFTKEEFQSNRIETNSLSKSNRDELSQSLNHFSQELSKSIQNLNSLLKEKLGEQNNLQKKNTDSFNSALERRFDGFAKYQKEINKQTSNNIMVLKDVIEKQLKSIREDNTKQLDEMRKTVDEKLQRSLNQRLNESFETVGKQLNAVQQGLGEMKNLAQDVGGLKKVLSNVKIRGNIGETQLSMLLEQILAPDQYEANVKTNPNSGQVVEFAIKLPGRDDRKSNIWLPIDAKFPKDVYEKVIEVYEIGDPSQVLIAQKNMENTIKKMAKDIHDKYIEPPYTTDFGIMFLPFENIYAEVVRNTSLLESLQKDYQVIVTGPTTLAAILNSLQMGFRTLAIQKRSGEVWRVLSGVKKEFETFGGMMQKAQKNIQTGLGQLDEVMGKRTRAIQKQLQNVETLTTNPEQSLLDVPED